MSTMAEDVIPGPGDARGYYQVLGVAKDATFDDIKRAAKQRLTEWHPDRAAGDADRRAREERSKLISEAKHTLGDLTRRRTYDSTVFVSQEDVRRREEDARRTEDARRERERERERARERARREEDARRAADAAARRREEDLRRAAEVEARLRAARRDAIWETAQRIAYSLWAVAFLAMVPMLTMRAIELSIENWLVNPITAVAAIFGLATSLIVLGVTTHVFEFVTPFSRRLASITVALQLLTIFLLIVLAPLLAFLFALLVTIFEVLKVVLLIVAFLIVILVIFD